MTAGTTRPRGRAPRWRRPGRRRPVVLLYHGFADAVRGDDPENMFVPLPALDAQLAWLRREGWATLSWAEYEAVRRGDVPRPRRSVLVTIDDAYESTGLGVAVLAEHGVPSIVYVPAGLVGRTARWLPEPRDEPLLDVEGLRRLQGPLVDLGVHGWDHTDMADRSEEDLVQQTAGARARLDDLFSGVVPSFAYPYGSHDAAARRAVADAGFVSAFSVFDDDGPLAVSRVDVNATDSVLSFRLKLMPGYRRVWRALGRAAVFRRLTRRVLTRCPDKPPSGRSA